MCVRVSCKKCGKPTYAGCGAHIESVLAGVAVADRCSCRSKPAEASGATGENKPFWKFW